MRHCWQAAWPTETSASTTSFKRPPVAEKASRRQLSSADRKGLILIVEDKDAVRALAARMLERSGYTVLCARDGNEALALSVATHEHIDVLLSDIVMPVMNGLEVARRLRVQRPDLRVIYMSGYVDDTAVVDAEQFAHETLVAKPFHIDTLTAAVETALASQRT